MRVVAFVLLTATAFAQTTAKKSPPDLQGIWQARNTAAGNLEAHSASLGVRGGASVVVDPPDGKIPYKPEALAKRNENFLNRATLDTVNKCFSPGVPRMMYLPFPFQIFQTAAQIDIASEFAHTIRHVYMNSHGHYAEAEFWSGDSRGKWVGQTLVIDSGNFNPETWFDEAGNHHSAQLKVIERLTRIADDKLNYEATITDPETFTRPWTIRMTLYRLTEPNAQLFEYECHMFTAEERKLAK
ncbi:MAG: hypothetical protein ABIR70_07545 [Bryobacteraceae bacterium]